MDLLLINNKDKENFVPAKKLNVIKNIVHVLLME
jgi:hypothetical protein